MSADTRFAKPRAPYTDEELLQHNVTRWTALTFEERVRLQRLRKRRRQMKLHDDPDPVPTQLGERLPRPTDVPPAPQPRRITDTIVEVCGKWRTDRHKEPAPPDYTV
jgi:hypothetical protein